MEYILWINDLIIKENDEEYDFLNEMYPEIKELYNKVWYLQHNSSNINIFNKIDKINSIKNEIRNQLKIYGIPEYILFKKEEDSFVEPVSKTSFNIVTKHIHLRKAEEEIVLDYMKNLKMEDVKFLKEKMPLFKEQIKNNNLTLNK